MRTVAASGVISFQGERHYIEEAFAGEPVAVRPNNEEKAQTEKAQTWAVYYCYKKVRVIDLNNHQC